MSELRAALKVSNSRFREWREYAIRLLEGDRLSREFDGIVNDNEWSD